MTAALARMPRHLDASPMLRTDAVSRHALRLVLIDRAGVRPPAVVPFATLPQHLRVGDVVVVNDAATLPASIHARTAAGATFELRLAAPIAGDVLDAVALGAGDHRTPTERRAAPPPLAAGDRLLLGDHALPAHVVAANGRRVTVRAEAGAESVVELVYADGQPIQYAHRSALLPLHEVQTAYAARPWAAEMPSAGRGLTWEVLLGLRRAGVVVARLTHAAGLSSTGDAALDRALPWPERYEIPAATAEAIATARAGHHRVIAVGTTVVRALEASGGTAGSGTATLRLDAGARPRVVDGLVSGLHAPGESHFELLSAFAPAATLQAALATAAAAGLSTHELGDACLVV